jgi:hypothetical protein
LLLKANNTSLKPKSEEFLEPGPWLRPLKRDKHSSLKNLKKFSIPTKKEASQSSLKPPRTKNKKKSQRPRPRKKPHRQRKNHRHQKLITKMILQKPLPKSPQSHHLPILYQIFQETSRKPFSRQNQKITCQFQHLDLLTSASVSMPQVQWEASLLKPNRRFFQ